MRACKRDTPPSSPPCGVRSTSGKILLTASSRPITTLSLPPRSNSWLSASTIKRAESAPGDETTGAAWGAWLKSGAGAGGREVAELLSTAAGAGVPSIFAPQLEQNDSPAGFCAPHDGQVCIPVAAGAEITWAAEASG